jgi:hypothetical protein
LTSAGTTLRIALLVYFSFVARCAVDNERGKDAPGVDGDAPGALARVNGAELVAMALDPRARASIDVGHVLPH